MSHRERAPREEPSRRPERPREGSGGGLGVPRQAPGSARDGDGIGGAAGGSGVGGGSRTGRIDSGSGSGSGNGRGSGVGSGGRRRAGAAEFGPAELAAALHESVSTIGTSGPPRAGLARVRRRAKARRRRHSVMAGSAGVLMLAVAVSAVTGNSFDIVPVLTGVVGLGGSHDASGAGPGPRGGGGGAGVRTVRPPADAAGKKGPAIGPVDAVAGVPTALAATGVAQCTAADLTTVTTVDAVIDGVSYGRVQAIAQRTCAVAGPPVLQVENAAGTAASSVVILQHAQSDGSQLPAVSTWGAVLKLTAGQGYDFQFAWAPDGCGGADTPADPAASSATGPSVPASGPSSAGGYTLSYLIGDVTPTEPVDLTAACGATVYVTDIYPRGAYPTAKAPVSPSAQPATSSAPPTTPSPTTASPSTAPTSTSSSPAATASSSATSSDGGTGDSPAGGAPSASPPSQPTGQ